MATQYIDISGSATRYSGKVRSLIDQARNLQDLCTMVVDVSNQISPPGSEDWVALAAQLGIDATKAQAFYGLLILFQAVINKANYDTFVDRLG